MSGLTAQIYIALQPKKENSYYKKIEKTTFQPPIELQYVLMFRVTAQIHDNLQHKKASTYKSYIVFEYPELQL